ncbi:MAG: hypothetical protein RLY58_863 [Pseudomonadota bacterium]|jgi:hypothetical protein
MPFGRMDFHLIIDFKCIFVFYGRENAHNTCDGFVSENTNKLCAS